MDLVDNKLLSRYLYRISRPLRIAYPSAWYHVTCPENKKRKIFSNDHHAYGVTIQDQH